LAGPPITLDRRADNDIFVDETTVSRRHALIMETPAGFVLRDLNSTNGTFLNRDKVDTTERVLKHGDRIQLAGSETVFVFRQEGPATGSISISDRLEQESQQSQESDIPSRKARMPPL
jgi:pSer/pThr/pTyr-binding forkhead associated (FHA) protein